MPTYPSNLPGFKGHPQEEYQDTVIRTEMSQGVIKTRRRFTQGSTFLTFRTLFTHTERISFLTFWRTEIAEGALPFTMKDLSTDTTATYKMMSTPTFRHLRGDGEKTVLYRMTVELEKLP